ncbi:MAG: hypothetical protein JWR04_2755 [Rhodoglobus sp.]|nr:hypothetical protein [Rhodoglobus sp.]
MEIAELVRLSPELYHMAADGSWPSIAEQGLLSSAALVARWEASGAEELLEQRRPKSVRIEHPEHGTAVIRDHGPIHLGSLEDALVDTSVAEWFEILNERVFFFLERKRLDSLLGAYKAEPQLVITADTASLVAAHENEIELCRINSGFAQRHNKVPRDRRSFVPIAEYSERKVAEPTVLGRVADITEHVTRVERVFQGKVIERLA